MSSAVGATEIQAPLEDQWGVGPALPPRADLGS